MSGDDTAHALLITFEWSVVLQGTSGRKSSVDPDNGRLSEVRTPALLARREALLLSGEIRRDVAESRRERGL